MRDLRGNGMFFWKHILDFYQLDAGFRESDRDFCGNDRDFRGLDQDVRENNRGFRGISRCFAKKVEVFVQTVVVVFRNNDRNFSGNDRNFCENDRSLRGIDFFFFVCVCGKNGDSPRGNDLFFVNGGDFRRKSGILLETVSIFAKKVGVFA